MSALGDHYGRTRLFPPGLVPLTAECLARALAPSLPLLLATHPFQGVAAAYLVARRSVAESRESAAQTAPLDWGGAVAATAALGGGGSPTPRGGRRNRELSGRRGRNTPHALAIVRWGLELRDGWPTSAG